ncbi:hypothetical protein I6A60_30250 [Frankia sp. AgB1.9]|nr:hypothetical protein [Frankia sp. AgW1.1]MBL7552111.1 hypothetical protein [Frankia sp. AgB1.9]MBL7622170.1 hypothetical protein [Frankia sp. AgB1.8]
MSALGWIILALCVIALAVLAVVFVHRLAQRGGGTHALRRRFGPEYDRAVEQTGDRQTAERRLAEIARRRDGLEIRPLDENERADYTARWDELQAFFVDDPTAATRQADQLITEVMRTRGYPVESFDERAELLAADRPAVVGPYRQANDEAASEGDGEGTEHLRAAFVHYREPFSWLVDGAAKPAATESSNRPAALA